MRNIALQGVAPEWLFTDSQNSNPLPNTDRIGRISAFDYENAALCETLQAEKWNIACAYTEAQAEAQV